MEIILLPASLIFEFARTVKNICAASVVYTVCMQYFLIDLKMW